MITFKEKTYAEHEATRILFNEIRRDQRMREEVKIIDRSQLIPVLKGNNVVIEKFVISTSMLGRDRYRMYLKLGAKIRLPESIRLNGYYRQNKLGGVSFGIKNNICNGDGNSGDGGNCNKNNKDRHKKNKRFSFSSGLNYKADILVDSHHLVGEVVKYNKESRELILEYTSPQDAVRSLWELPFGFDYRVYLLKI